MNEVMLELFLDSSMKEWSSSLKSKDESSVTRVRRFGARSCSKKSGNDVRLWVRVIRRYRR